MINKIKVICTVSDGNYIAGNIYEAEAFSTILGYPNYIFKDGLPINASFITLAEWREKQINSILDE
jgi:hypothetical protein